MMTHLAQNRCSQDEILSMGAGVIVPKTTTAKSNRGRAVSAGMESVAQILKRERDSLIHDWLTLVEDQDIGGDEFVVLLF
jgi:hypothetical protein